MADQDLEMFAVIGKIAAALSQSAGHTVEVYKAEESMPNFRVFITTIEEGDHAVVMLRGSKITVIPLFRETPEKLIWHIPRDAQRGVTGSKSAEKCASLKRILRRNWLKAEYTLAQ